MSMNTIVALHEQGKSYTEIAKLTGRVKSVIAYHVKKHHKGKLSQPTGALRYNWKEIGEYAKTHLVRECRAKFGFTNGTWSAAVKAGRVSPRPRVKQELASVMTENSTYQRTKLKTRLIRAKILNYVCAICGNTGVWLGQKLSLQLDHQNGKNRDNRLENLRLLCPNCHSQTPTFSGRNKSVL